MAKNLPLEILVKNIEDGKTIEFLIGETQQQLESAGRLTVYKMDGFETIGYTPSETKKINSFHIRKDAYGNKTTRKLAPNKEILLKEQDTISWGYEEPLVGIECHNRNLN